MPSGEVITRLPVPVMDTATNRLNSAAHTIASHWFAAAAERAVQVVPLGEVITLFVPSSDTAANSASEGDQAMPRHWLSAALVLAVHVSVVGGLLTVILFDAAAPILVVGVPYSVTSAA